MTKAWRWTWIDLLGRQNDTARRPKSRARARLGAHLLLVLLLPGTFCRCLGSQGRTKCDEFRYLKYTAMPDIGRSLLLSEIYELVINRHVKVNISRNRRYLFQPLSGVV